VQRPWRIRRVGTEYGKRTVGMDLIYGHVKEKLVGIGDV
jgi:hypothetical protein